jgi:hypothetical protein
LQSRTPSKSFRQHPDRQRSDPHADDQDTNGQRRERWIWREHRARNGAGCYDDGVVGAGKGLGDGKNAGVAGGEAIVRELDVWFRKARQLNIPSRNAH